MSFLGKKKMDKYLAFEKIKEGGMLNALCGVYETGS